MFAAANELRIREIDPENPDQLFSPNLHRVAREKGWWKPEDGPLDWVALNYRDISKDIAAKHETPEKEADAAITAADQKALELHKTLPESARTYLTAFSTNTANNIFTIWQRFGDDLIARYADGGINYPGRLNIKTGYPREWLMTTDWPKGPVRYEKPE